ncbi:MAG: TusE/DsrC/DsvC family sulfur relay protein [Chloroflexi bacterium]|nr:TusE/DsrC/DsvC family sulfur relay protein [Chloroflexota bacterium]
MITLKVNDRVLTLDEEGFLVNPADWSEEAAHLLAKSEGIELTERHWKVIRFAREYYETNGASPTLRQISKGAGVPTKELFSLFPKGPAKKVARIAGIPKPAGCV